MTLYFDAFQVILLFVSVLLVRLSPDLVYGDANSLGELSHCRWQIALAGGCAADDDVFDYRRGCMVCILIICIESTRLILSAGSIPTRPSKLLNIIRYTDSLIHIRWEDTLSCSWSYYPIFS